MPVCPIAPVSASRRGARPTAILPVPAGCAGSRGGSDVRGWLGHQARQRPRLRASVPGYDARRHVAPELIGDGMAKPERGGSCRHLTGRAVLLLAGLPRDGLRHGGGVGSRCSTSARPESTRGRNSCGSGADTGGRPRTVMADPGPLPTAGPGATTLWRRIGPPRRTRPVAGRARCPGQIQGHALSNRALPPFVFAHAARVCRQRQPRRGTPAHPLRPGSCEVPCSALRAQERHGLSRMEPPGLVGPARSNGAPESATIVVAYTRSE